MFDFLPVDSDVYPRLVKGIPNEQYQAMNDHVSRSNLVRVMHGGGEVQARIEQGHSQFSGNAGTTLGSLFDALIEAHIAGKTFRDVIVRPPDDVLDKSGGRRGAKYKAWKESAAKDGLLDVNAEQEFALLQMYDSLFECRPARELVEATVHTQLSGFFVWEGTHCRVRLDGATDESASLPPCWWDLKTTSAEIADLPKSVDRFGYAAQEAMYLECAYQLGWPEHSMPFVFVQSIEPFRTRVQTIPPEFVSAVKARLVNTLHEMRLRKQTGIYRPAEADEITEMVIPTWMWASYSQEEVFANG